MTNRSTTLLAAFAAAAFVATAMPAGAQTFFGQDIRWVLDGPATVAGTNSEAARTAFLSNLIGVGTEDFESFADGTTAPLNLAFPGAGTATLSAANGEIETAIGSGRKATSGSAFWEVGTGNSASNQFTISFGSEVAAFGVYGIDVGDFGDQLTLSFYNSGSLVSSWSPLHGVGGNSNGPNDGNLNFFGYIDTNNLFDEIRFSSAGSTGAQDFWGFDDMTIGSIEQVVVPEPASALLLLTGVAGLVAARRRKNA